MIPELPSHDLFQVLSHISGSCLRVSLRVALSPNVNFYLVSKHHHASFRLTFTCSKSTSLEGLEKGVKCVQS